MITVREIAAGLHGAWRLAQFDRRGLAFFDATPDGFWKSFAAAGLVLPGHAAVFLLARANLGVPLWRTAAIGLIAYVIGWVAFPLAMAGICDLIDRRSRYLGFIVAANWGSVLQTALLVPMALLRLYDGAGAAMPDGSAAIDQGGSAALLLYLAAFIAVLVYGWFIARAALEVDGVTAAGLVVFSVLLDLLITGTGDVLLIRD